MEARSVVGDFAVVDELLALGQAGELAALGPITVGRSGRIGPVIEFVRARRHCVSQFAQVSIQAPFANTVDRALDDKRVLGESHGAKFGIFPLTFLAPDGEPTDEWTQWYWRADQAAQLAGFSKPAAAMVMGGFGELVDNVFRHSQASGSAIVAFAIVDGGIELVVSDNGIGVLESLRSHPDYADLPDSGAALRQAIANGESRFGRDSGSGLGIGQIFRALANQDGDLRFRSGDHVLEIRGHSPSLTGHLDVRHRAELPGLTVSVLCRPFGRPD